MKKYLMLLCLLIFVGCNAQHELADTVDEIYMLADDNYTIEEASMFLHPHKESGVVDVYVFGFPSADAILITTENYVVLIDTGERQHGRMISDALFARTIFHIDYLIITHFDRDHVGGAYYVLRFLEVRNLIVPNYERVSNSVNRLNLAKQREGVEAYVLTETITLTLDDAVIVIKPSGLDFFVFGNEDDDDNYEATTDIPSENDFSIIVSVGHGENNFLFTGDAMAGRLGEFLEFMETEEIPPFDFLKLPHHGRHNRRTMEFLAAVNPRYAVSTCCFNRPADERVVTFLESINAEIFFSKFGGVHVRSDGVNLMVTQ
ncbi:MAG: MBL fold metallo-hydrolase [Defluviitaleaceae bacterium]|nr:MBL fold metallo-hydrolase [Defluviitaleaceae bacterium]